MEWLAAFGGSLLEAIAQFITSRAGIWLVCIVIGATALWFYWLDFKRRIRPLLRDLRSGVKVIEQAAGPEEFASAFHDVDEEILKIALLRDSWREFKATLLFPEPDDGASVVSVVQPPDYYFHRDALLGRKLNLRLYNAIPNLLTGAGILGTFVGLVAGIYLASGGLASEDIAEAKQAMQTLLNGASLAFITSIVGLVSSIAFSIREKHWVHQFDGLLGNWISALESRLRRVTPEGMVREQLLQTRQQTQVLEGFTDQLAFQIAEAFDQRLQAHVTDSIAPALGKLVDGIDALREDRQKTDEAVLEKLLSTFTGELKGAAGTEMDSLAETLQSLNDNLKSQTEDAEKRHRENQKALSNAFSQAIQGLDETIGRMKEIATQNETVATKVAELVKGLVSATQDMKGLSDPIQAAAKAFKSTGDSVATQVQTLQTAAETVASAAKQLAASNAQTQQSWGAYEKRFKDIDEALGKVFTELSDGVQAYTSQVNDLLSHLDRHTAEISGVLGGASEGLGDKIEDLDERFEAFLVALGRGRRQ